HQSKLSHELIESAAGFENMRIREKAQRRKGRSVHHGTAKELLAAAVGFEVDGPVETKELDAIGREGARRHAKEQAELLYDRHYGEQGHYGP
ncbi:hypothetical protein P885DRAFT_25334, partial [Corynascus similis CBS 632.67]